MRPFIPQHRSRQLTLAASPLLLATLCAPAVAQEPTTAPAPSTVQQVRYGPDLLQTLSVGARATGMGSAYSVIANDSSATFWNPACLDNILGKRQFDIEYRTVPQSIGSTKDNNGTVTSLPGYPQFHVNDLQISFVGFAVPLQIKVPGKLDPKTLATGPTKTTLLGTLGFSYALGGYANLESITANVGGTSPNVTNTLNSVTSIVRNSIFTAAYGNHVRINHDSGQFQYGAGVYFLSQDQLLSQASSIGLNGLTPPALNTITPTLSSDHQSGVGYILGFTFRQDYRDKTTKQISPGSGQWIYGVTYRSGPQLSGAKTSLLSFDKEIPDRATVGLAYDSKMHHRDGFTYAAEVQRLSSANGATYLDTRRYVTNFNTGLEYTPGKFSDQGLYRFPIRLGFHTIANGNSNLFSYDDAVTFGSGIQSKGKNGTISSFEGALEYLTISHKLQYNLSTRFRF